MLVPNYLHFIRPTNGRERLLIAVRDGRQRRKRMSALPAPPLQLDDACSLDAPSGKALPQNSVKNLTKNLAKNPGGDFYAQEVKANSTLFFF